MYDSHILDMVEFGIEQYRGLKEFKTQKVCLGIKPCLLFAGELFEHNHEYQRIKSLLIDMFQREKVQAVRLQGLEHVLMFTAAEDRIYFRSYRCARCFHNYYHLLYPLCIHILLITFMDDIPLWHMNSRKEAQTVSHNLRNL